MEGRIPITARACAQRGTRGDGGASPFISASLRILACIALAVALLASCVDVVYSFGASIPLSVGKATAKADNPQYYGQYEYALRMFHDKMTRDNPEMFPENQQSVLDSQVLALSAAATTGVNFYSLETDSTHGGSHMPVFPAIGNVKAWDDLTETEQASFGNFNNYNCYNWIKAYQLTDFGPFLIKIAEEYVENNGPIVDGDAFIDQLSYEMGMNSPLDAFIRTCGSFMANDRMFLYDCFDLITNPKALFKHEDLGVLYTNRIDGLPLVWAIYDIAYGLDTTQPITNTNWMYGRWGDVLTSDFYQYYFYVSQPSAGNVITIEEKQSGNNTNYDLKPSNYYYRFKSNDGEWTYNGTATLYPYRYNTLNGYLNMLYEGTYILPSGVEITDGNIPDGVSQEPNYPHLPATPDAITYNIINNYGDTIINNIYPDRPDDTVPVVRVPDDGIDDTTPWTRIVTIENPDDGGGGGSGGGGGDTPENPFEPGDRTDNPFNPDDTSGTPEFTEDMDAELNPIWGLPLDKLFPFCLIWDIGKLVEKVYEIGGYSGTTVEAQSTSMRSLYADRTDLIAEQKVNIRKLETQDADSGGSGGGDLPGPSNTDWFVENKPEWTAGHTEIVIPLVMESKGFQETVIVDVWPLAVIIAWVRPFLQIASVVALLFLSIQFFRRTIFSG